MTGPLSGFLEMKFCCFSACLAYLFNGRLQEAENVFQSSLCFCDKHGVGQFTSFYETFLAPTLIAKGHMKQGAEILGKTRKTLLRNQRRHVFAISEYILGEVYSQIATGPRPSFSIMVKNIGFLARNISFAAKKAEEHFNKAIELLKEIGAKGFLGPVYLSLGLLCKNRKKNEKARQYILEAINIFRDCGAGGYLKQANEVLESLR